MSPRLIKALLIATTLIALIGFQLHRERLVEGCLKGGGAWDGSRCGPQRSGPILRRDLYRA